MAARIKVLMIGPDREMKGGISTVVNNYYGVGLDRCVDLTYLSTIVDGRKIVKLWKTIQSSISFSLQYKRFDVLHVHMAANASFIRKALLIRKAYKAGIPIIIQEHGGDFNSFYSKLNKDEQETVKCIFDMADEVIALSEEWKDYFQNGICAPEKITVLHNGVIIPNAGVEVYHSHNVLFLGRLCEEKGIYDLLKAIPYVIDVVPDAQFFLCGDGEQEKVRKEISRLGIEHHVDLPGWIRGDEKEKLFQKCATLVLPSYYEAMPMAVLEAMSYGYAVISTNVGGIPQIIDGSNGVLYKPGDNKILTEKLVHILKNDEIRAEYGCRARQTIIDRFDLRRNVFALYEKYQRIVKQNAEKRKRRKTRGGVGTFRLLKMMRKI